MRLDFTPRFFRDPKSDAAAAAAQVESMKELIELYQKVQKISEKDAQIKAEAAKQTNTINKEIRILNNQMHEIVFESDYLYRNFQETTTELKNQNVLLKLGKSTFKGLTDIAQDLNYFQRGTTDLTDKNFKKMQSGLKIQEKELDYIVQRSGNKKGEFAQQDQINRLQSISADKLNAGQKRKLANLQKEKDLYYAAKDALENGIPILQKEYEISKQIYDVREDLGGLAKGAAGVVSKFGGSLAQFLNVGDAIDSVNEYNKSIIDGALKNKKVLGELEEIDKKRRDIQYELESGRYRDAKTGQFIKATEEERNKRQLQLNALEKEGADVRKKAIDNVGKNIGNKFKSLGVLAKGLGEGLTKSLTDPVTILTFFVGKALEANEQAVILGKTIGYGTDRADRLRENFAFIAGVTPNINVNSKSITEAFGELAKTTGYVYQYSADQLATQVKLTKQVGLQADEAAQIQRFAVLNGKTSEETYSSFVKGLTTARNQLRVGIDFKSALAEASKISGQLAAQLGNNPETIAKAVVSAKALGMTLEQVAKAGSTLLDFGTSISNELEAELLTGRQLNLERARAAALAGDQITLAEELAKNMGTAADFTKLNKLQQDSLAKSVGMTSDELAETLRKREEAIASGKSLAQITEEEAKQALERQQIQEKFSAALLKIQDVVGNLVAGPFGQLFDLVSNIASIFTNIISPVITGISYVVGLIVEGFKTLAPILVGIAGVLAVVFARSIAIAIADIAQNAFKNFSGFGPFGFPLAIAATLAGVGLVTRLAKGTKFAKGGIVTGEINNATVGEAGPEAIIPLNSPKADKILGNGEGQIDLTPMIAAINEVRAAVDRLYSKDQSINMDGKKVGTTLVQGSYKVA